MADYMAKARELVNLLQHEAGVDGDHYAPCFRDCLADNRDWVEKLIAKELEEAADYYRPAHDDPG